MHWFKTARTRPRVKWGKGVLLVFFRVRHGLTIAQTGLKLTTVGFHQTLGKYYHEHFLFFIFYYASCFYNQLKNTTLRTADWAPEIRFLGLCKLAFSYFHYVSGFYTQVNCSSICINSSPYFPQIWTLSQYHYHLKEKFNNTKLNIPISISNGLYCLYKNNRYSFVFV